MADPLRWIDVTEDAAGLTMTRRLPRLSSVVAVSFAATGAALAAVPDIGDLGGWVLGLGLTITGVTMPLRVQARAQAPLARWFGWRIVVTPGRAGSDYRDAGVAATITVDGSERPLADLRRVGVAHQMMLDASRPGEASYVVTAAMVALIFDDDAVLVGFERTDEAARALAGGIAHLAGRPMVRLPDAVVAVSDPRPRHERGNLFQRVVSVEQWRHMAHFAGQVSPARAAAFGLFAMTVAVAAMVGAIVIAGLGPALTRDDRWVVAAASLAAWVLADAVMLRGCVAIVCDTTLAKTREVYGLGGSTAGGEVRVIINEAPGISP